MSQPYIITFAGVPGSSKSIIAHYLSITSSLPIFATDRMRDEVKEELLLDDINEPAALAEYERRRDERWYTLLKDKQSFIYDGAVDRQWSKIKADLQEYDYQWLLININLSEDFMSRLYKLTGRAASLEELPYYLKQHEAFVHIYKKDISVTIIDKTFASRIHIAKDALDKFLADR